MTYDELLAEIRRNAKEYDRLEALLSKQIDEFNGLREERATAAALKRFAVSPGIYIRVRGNLFQIKTITYAEMLGVYDFRQSRFSDKDSPLRANCSKITKSTGKPMMTGSYNRHEVTERVNLEDGRFEIVPPDQVTITRKKAEVSDAKKKLAGLSDAELKKALKAAGIE